MVSHDLIGGNIHQEFVDNQMLLSHGGLFLSDVELFFIELSKHDMEYFLYRLWTLHQRKDGNMVVPWQAVLGYPVRDTSGHLDMGSPHQHQSLQCLATHLPIVIHFKMQVV